MKLLSLLLALLLIGFVIKKQLDTNSTSQKLEELIERDGIDAPKLPSSANEYSKFEKDINNFVLDSADKRKQEL